MQALAIADLVQNEKVRRGSVFWGLTRSHQDKDLTFWFQGPKQRGIPEI